MSKNSSKSGSQETDSAVSNFENTTLVDNSDSQSPGTKVADVLASYRDDSLYNPEVNEVKEREFHSEKNSSYWLPKDEDEQQRLTGQHFAVKELFEGNVLPKVHEIIDFKKNVSVLDVGCGSGVWIMDMFNDYPNCTYQGCDIVDIAYKNVNLKQISYSFGNVVEGLKYPDNTFDFVSMRFLVLALKEEEWPIAIKELLRVTKPGGVIQLIEGNLEKIGGPVFRKLLGGIHMTCKMRGQNPRIALKLEDLIEEVGGTKIVQSEDRSVNLAGDSSASKKIRWDWEKGAASILPVIGAMVEMETIDKQTEYLKSLHYELEKVDADFLFRAVVAQKL